MANKKISELTTATALVGTEEFAIIQDGVTKKVAVSELGGGTKQKITFQRTGRAYTNLFGGSNAGKFLKYYNVETNSYAIATTFTDENLVVPNYSTPVYKAPITCKMNLNTFYNFSTGDYELLILKASFTGVNSQKIYYEKRVGSVVTKEMPDVTINEGEWLHIFMKKETSGQIFYSEHLMLEEI